MTELTEYAYAKLNLSLDVVAKLQNGYHELCMLMQSVSLCDDVHVALRSDEKITVKTDLRYLPNDERNIAYKAAAVFFAKTGLKHGADISLKKRIPVCAGLGGGSSDGAAVLRALNTLTEKPLCQMELEEAAESVGSDVPFCVCGGTALARGRGEILESLSPLPDCRLVICKPRFSVSTPELFARLDKHPVKYHPDTSGLLESIENGSLCGVAMRMYNVFEDVLPPKPADVPEIKRTLLDCGALGAVMTGTGSAVFGLFEDSSAAEAAKKKLKSQYTDVFIASPQKKLKI